MAQGSSAAEGALTELFIDEDKIHHSLVPDDVVIRDYLSCINDDTWVRHAELVNLSDLKESKQEEEVKGEVLRTFIEERRRSGVTPPRDLIMEGILWQEKFMDEYKKEHSKEDRREAASYKQSLMSNFRMKRNGAPGIQGGAAADTKAIEYTRRQVAAAAKGDERKEFDRADEHKELDREDADAKNKGTMDPSEMNHEIDVSPAESKPAEAPAEYPTENQASAEHKSDEAPSEMNHEIDVSPAENKPAEAPAEYPTENQASAEHKSDEAPSEMNHEIDVSPAESKPAEAPAEYPTENQASADNSAAPAADDSHMAEI